MVLAALLAASCTSVTTSPRGTGSSSITPTSTTRSASAVGDLNSYFTAAAEVDQRLKAAAVDANAAIGATQITITGSTLDAIAAADPASATLDIPAGLPEEVLLGVLKVQSDLVSRFYAFRGFTEAQPGTISRAEQSSYLSAADYLLTCLGNGSQAARSFQADLSAARTAASKVPPITPVDPSSRSAADLAIWLRQIEEANSGCDGCGGSRLSALAPITWHHVAPLTAGGNPWDGDIGGLLFAAQYMPVEGWNIQLNAC